MKTSYKTILAATLLLLTSNLMAENYKIYGSNNVETIPLKYELARKVIPIFRTLITLHGHIAYLQDSDYLIVKASPYTIEKIREILATVTVENFDAQALTKIAAEKLTKRNGSSNVTRIVKLRNLDAKNTVAALRGLVDNYNMSVVEGTNDLQITDDPDFVDEMVRMIRELDGF